MDVIKTCRECYFVENPQMFFFNVIFKRKKMSMYNQKYHYWNSKIVKDFQLMIEKFTANL